MHMQVVSLLKLFRLIILRSNGYLLPIVLLTSSFFAPRVHAASVVSVGDGDSIRVLEGKRGLTIRLACIDAPESSQLPWGINSKSLLKQLLPIGSEVSLDIKTKDRYGRLVAEIFSNRRNINQIMVQSGQAFAYRNYLRHCDAQKYLQLEASAQRRAIGVWSVGYEGIKRPWEYRRLNRTVPSASKSTRKYRCKDITSWSEAQQLLAQGHSYLDGDRDGEACESLR